MTSEYYNHIVFLRKKYLKFFAKDTQIVDIGCGDGTFIRMLEENDYSAIGIDSDAVSVKKCQEENLHVIQKDAISFLQENQNSFGGIICSHLIEHIPYDRTNFFIKSCYDAMCESGSLLIITPNINNLGGSANFWNDPTHVRPFTISSLKKLISKNMFKIKHIGYDKDSMISIRKNPFYFPIDILRQFISILIYGKNALYTELVVIARKS